MRGALRGRLLAPRTVRGAARSEAAPRRPLPRDHHRPVHREAQAPGRRPLTPGGLWSQRDRLQDGRERPAVMRSRPWPGRGPTRHAFFHHRLSSALEATGPPGPARSMLPRMFSPGYRWRAPDAWPRVGGNAGTRAGGCATPLHPDDPATAGVCGGRPGCGRRGPPGGGKAGAPGFTPITCQGVLVRVDLPGAASFRHPGWSGERHPVPAPQTVPRTDSISSDGQTPPPTRSRLSPRFCQLKRCAGPACHGGGQPRRGDFTPPRLRRRHPG